MKNKGKQSLMTNVNILLVEDHKLVRDGIKMLLESKNEYDVVAEASHADDALAILANDVQIDLVITDINMSGMDGVALTENIQQLYPHIKVIVLSMLQDDEHVSKSFHAGAKAYLIKSSHYNELLFAIEHVINGGKYMCESVMMDMIQKTREMSENLDQTLDLMKDLDLSEREMEVLQLIGDGYTNNEIAEKLFLSKRTVEGHRQNLIDKTHVKNSAQLVKYAVKNGLI